MNNLSLEIVSYDQIVILSANVNAKRFVFDDGSPYYPLGYNLGWRNVRGMAPLAASIAKMGKAGVNWTRIWMNYWDGKNLDWTHEPKEQPPTGELSLTAARQWDGILAAAEETGLVVPIGRWALETACRQAEAWRDAGAWGTAAGAQAAA